MLLAIIWLRGLARGRAMRSAGGDARAAFAAQLLRRQRGHVGSGAGLGRAGGLAAGAAAW